MTKSLSRRLERLEARAIPAGEPMVIRVQFVSADKVVIDTLSIEIGAHAHEHATRGHKQRRSENARGGIGVSSAWLCVESAERPQAPWPVK
jgi:hypothetical protein